MTESTSWPWPQLAHAPGSPDHASAIRPPHAQEYWCCSRMQSHCRWCCHQPRCWVHGTQSPELCVSLTKSFGPRSAKPIQESSQSCQNPAVMQTEQDGKQPRLASGCAGRYDSEQSTVRWERSGGSMDAAMWPLSVQMLTKCTTSSLSTTLVCPHSSQEETHNSAHSLI